MNSVIIVIENVIQFQNDYQKNIENFMNDLIMKQNQIIIKKEIKQMINEMKKMFMNQFHKNQVYHQIMILMSMKNKHHHDQCSLEKYEEVKTQHFLTKNN